MKIKKLNDYFFKYLIIPTRPFHTILQYPIVHHNFEFWKEIFSSTPVKYSIGTLYTISLKYIKEY